MISGWAGSTGATVGAAGQYRNQLGAAHNNSGGWVATVAPVRAGRRQPGFRLLAPRSAHACCPCRRAGRPRPSPPETPCIPLRDGEQPRPRGRQPEGEHALGNAERQAHWRARRQVGQTPSPARYRRPTDRRVRSEFSRADLDTSNLARGTVRATRCRPVELAAINYRDSKTRLPFRIGIDLSAGRHNMHVLAIKHLGLDDGKTQEFGTEGQYGPEYDWKTRSDGSKQDGSSLSAAAGGSSSFQEGLRVRHQAFDALVQRYVRGGHEGFEHPAIQRAIHAIDRGLRAQHRPRWRVASFDCAEPAGACLTGPPPFGPIRARKRG